MANNVYSSINNGIKNANLGILGTTPGIGSLALGAYGAYNAGKALFSNPIKPQTTTPNSLTNSIISGGLTGVSGGTNAASLSKPNGFGGGGGGSYGDSQTSNYSTPTYSNSSPSYSQNYNSTPSYSSTQNSSLPSLSNYSSNQQNSLPQQKTPNQSTTPTSNPYNDQLKALQDRINSLNDSFSQYLSPSQQETDTQAQLDALTGQQRNLAASEALGLANIQGKPIALNFQQGQSAALQRQAAAQEQALGAQAEPLSTQLARLQAQRQNQAELAKYQLGNIQNEYTNLQRQSKPIKINGNLVRLNPATGQYETLFSSPGKDAEGFTLSEGQQRFDAKGNLLASGAPKTQEELTNDIKNYNFAKSQGYGGSFTDFQNSGGSGGSNKLNELLSPSESQLLGVPYGTTRGQAAQLGINVGGSSGGGRPLSDSQAKLISEGNQLSSVLNPIQDLIRDKSNLFGPLNGLGGYNPLNTDAQTANAQLKTAAQIVGSYLENGKLTDADVPKYQQLLPKLTDTPQVAQNKLNNISNLIRQKQQQYIQDFSSAGFNTSGFSGGNRSNTSQVNPQELQQLRSAGYSDQQIQQFLSQRGFNQPVSSGANSSGTIKIPQSSTLAYVNNNPGNLRYVGQTGAVPGRGGFAKFESPEAGYQALKNQIQIRVNQGKNLASFISQYAPPSENDTNGYINVVSRQLGVSPTTPLKQINLDALARAVAQHESSTKIG